MHPFKRRQRVAPQIKREVADIIMNRLKEPLPSFVTITDVDLSADMKMAHVYVTAHEDSTREAVIEALTRARSYIRLELGRRLQMRSVPELNFHYDESVAYGDQMERLMRKLKDEGQL